MIGGVCSSGRIGKAIEGRFRRRGSFGRHGHAVDGRSCRTNRPIAAMIDFRNHGHLHFVTVEDIARVTGTSRIVERNVQIAAMECSLWAGKETKKSFCSDYAS